MHDLLKHGSVESGGFFLGSVRPDVSPSHFISPINLPTCLPACLPSSLFRRPLDGRVTYRIDYVVEGKVGQNRTGRTEEASPPRRRRRPLGLVDVPLLFLLSRLCIIVHPPSETQGQKTSPSPLPSPSDLCPSWGQQSLSRSSSVFSSFSTSFGIPTEKLGRGQNINRFARCLCAAMPNDRQRSGSGNLRRLACILAFVRSSVHASALALPLPPVLT